MAKKDGFTSGVIRDKLLLIDPWYRLIMEMLQSIAFRFNERQMIEVGCGFGGFLINAAQRGAIVVGLDISAKAVRIAKDLVKLCGLQANVDLVIGDAQFSPFKSNVGGIVICAETLEHVPNYKEAFKEIVRITSRSGYLCLSVPNFFSTAFFENVILLLVGQPGYVKSSVCVDKEHVFHVFKLKELLVQRNLEVVMIRSVDFLHIPPRIRRILKLDNSLCIISGKLEKFFADRNLPLRLMGANIGVLVKKK